MTQDSESRALEALGAAINRASGVLSSVGELYSREEDRFHGGSSFAAHAVTTAHGLMVEAGAALVDLYAAIATRAEQDAAERQSLAAALAEAQALTAVETEVADDVAVEEAVIEDDDDSVIAWHRTPNDEQVAVAAVAPDDFARSYEELLRKVTAFEVFARQQDSDGGAEAQQELLPLVESLKEDLIKLSRVA